MKKSMKKAEKLKNVLLLQGVIVLYTVSSVMSKEASASGDNLLRFLFFFWNGICDTGRVCSPVAADDQAL